MGCYTQTCTVKTKGQGEMANRIWIFDLDGTLIQAGRSYGRTILEFVQLMLDVFGWRSPHWFETASLVNSLDYKQFETWGASRDRLPSTLVEVYRQLCSKVGVPYDEDLALRIWRLGESASSLEFYRQDHLIPGVEETLNFLQSKGDLLFVLTKGDLVTQRRKWWGYKLGRWFPTPFEFIVVRWEPALGYPGDKKEVMIDLRRLYPDRRIYMAGDSIKADIIPAVEVGLTAIHIPPYWRWHWQRGKPLLPKGVIELREIREIIERYDELTSRSA